MKPLKRINKRLVFVFSVATLVFGAVAPATLPMLASAATMDNRSIKMSSSKPGETGVKYILQFNAPDAIDAGGGLEIDFCSDSPLIGISSCDTTAGTIPDVTSAVLDSVTFSGSAPSSNGSISSTASSITWTSGTGSGYAADDEVVLTFSGITNPSSARTFFARVTSYQAADFSTYQSPSVPGDYTDAGGIAMATANQIGITAYVQESLSLCVSGSTSATNNGKPDDGCTNTSDPNLDIGEVSGGVKALDSTKLSTGLDYAQLGTNAAHGAVVNLKSNNVGCGGLVRPNDGTNCDITAATTQTSALDMVGSATFGLILGPDEATTNGTNYGSLTKDAAYSNTDYYLNYVTGDATGVTSTYGSPLFSTTGPVANRNMPITFGISPAASTPAGAYEVELGLIATATF